MRESLIKWTSISLAAAAMFLTPGLLLAQSGPGGEPPGADVVEDGADAAEAAGAGRHLRQPPDMTGEQDGGGQDSQEGMQAGPEDGRAAGKQAGKIVRLTPLQQIRACNRDLKEAAARLKNLEKRLGKWKDRTRKAAMNEREAWSRVARGFIKNWMWREGLLSENRKRCETFYYKIAVRPGGLTLTVRGRLLRYAKAKRKLDELASKVEGLRIEAQDLHPVPGGVCHVQVIPGCKAAEDGMKRRSYASLEGMDVDALPDAGRCESLGEALREKRARGELHIPGQDLDIWVNKDGDLALCSRDEGGWYVRDTDLNDFSALVLDCGG